MHEKNSKFKESLTILRKRGRLCISMKHSGAISNMPQTTLILCFLRVTWSSAPNSTVFVSYIIVHNLFDYTDCSVYRFFQVVREIDYFRYIDKNVFTRNSTIPRKLSTSRGTRILFRITLNQTQTQKLTNTLEIVFFTVGLAIQLEKATLIKGTASRFMTYETFRVPITAQRSCINWQNRKTTRNTFWRDLLWVTVLAKGLTEKLILDLLKIEVLSDFKKYSLYSMVHRVLKTN